MQIKKIIGIDATKFSKEQKETLKNNALYIDIDGITSEEMHYLSHYMAKRYKTEENYKDFLCRSSIVFALEGAYFYVFTQYNNKNHFCVANIEKEYREILNEDDIDIWSFYQFLTVVQEKINTNNIL